MEEVMVSVRAASDSHAHHEGNGGNEGTEELFFMALHVLHGGSFDLECSVTAVTPTDDRVAAVITFTTKPRSHEDDTKDSTQS